MNLPPSSGAGRNSRPRDEAPEPKEPSAPSRGPASGGGRGGQFLRPQLPKFGPSRDETEDFEEDDASAPPPRDRFGARHGAERPAAEADDSRSYPAADYDRSWSDPYDDEDSYEQSAQGRRDPWSRDWGAWSAAYLPDEGFEEDDELGGSWRRDAWGMQPSGFTMASVAIEVAPPSRRRAARPKGPAFQQIMRWVLSGFKEKPTKNAMRLLVVTSILGVIVLSGLGTALYAYNDYRIIRDEATAASKALSHLADDLGLSKGDTKTKLDATQTQAALDKDLGIAMRDLQDVRYRLQHPDFVLQLAGGIPSVRDKLQSGLVLSEVGIDAVTMLQKLEPTLVSVANLLITAPIGNTSTDNSPLLGPSDPYALALAFQGVRPIVDHMVATIRSTPPNVLVAALSAKQQSELLPLLQGVPELPTILNIVSEFLTVKDVNSLLGISQPVAYLIMTLDNTELRPVGGFQGQYAVVGVRGGHVGHISLQDVYSTLEPVTASYPPPRGQQIQAYDDYRIPQQNWYNVSYSGLGWAMRNSGLSADFPTSARYALWYLHNENICNWTNTKHAAGYVGVDGRPHFCDCSNGLSTPDYTCILGGDRVPVVNASGKITSYPAQRTPMAGVIMIQEKVIEQLLDVVGPIKVGCPYNKWIDAAHLQYYIHYYQETARGRAVGADTSNCGATTGLSDATKRFTALLTQALQAKLKTIPKTQLFKFAGDLVQDLHNKDIQIYLTDPSQSQDSGQSAWYNSPDSVYPPLKYGEGFLEKYQISSQLYSGDDDSLAFNRADMSGWKMELYVKIHLMDNITIQSDGTVKHDFSTKYDFNIPPIAVAKSPNGAIDDQKTQEENIFNIVYNAGFNLVYGEYWRIYTNASAKYLSDNYIYNPKSYSIQQVNQSGDIQNRAYFQGQLSYQAFYDESNPNVQWSYVTDGNPQHSPTPNVSWQVDNVIHGNKYNLHLNPQSGVDADYQITITGPCGKKPFTGPLDTNKVLTVPVANCSGK